MNSEYYVKRQWESILRSYLVPTHLVPTHLVPTNFVPTPLVYLLSNYWFDPNKSDVIFEIFVFFDKSM